MRAYRIIRECYFKEERDILKTEYSATVNGRWNERLQPVLYTGDSIETVVAEAGLYWILRNAESLNRMAKGKPITSWQEVAQKFTLVPGKIAELEMSPDLNILFLGDPSKANTELSAAGFQHIHYDTYLKHAYLTLSGIPTRRFGKWIQNKGYDGFQIASARHTGGLCTIIFEPKATQGGVRVINTFDVNLYGLKQNGHRIDSKFATYDEQKFAYEINNSVKTLTPDKR